MDYGLCFFHSYLQSFWISLFIVTFVFIIIKTLTLKPESSKFPPGPKPWPVVGNLPEMLANQPVFRWIHEILEEMNTEIACIRLGNVHVIPVSCPTLACEFLKTHDAAFASRPLTMATDIISDGYLTTTVAPFGEQQKKMKKMVVDHLLSPLRDQCLLDKRNEEADNLMFYVYNNVKDNGGLVNVRIAARHYCGNLVRKLTFNTRYFGKGGKDAGGPGFEEVEHVDAAFTLLRYAFAFCVSDYIPCLRRLDLDGHKSKVKNAMRIVKKYHDPIIEDRIKRWSDGSKTTVEDWLDALISAKDVNNNPLLTLKEIKAQTTELLLAMLDNPSNAFEWALAEMINQPKLLQQATEELDNVVGKNRLVQESDIPKLNFVKACAREALRLHPVSPFTVPHVSMSDTIVGNYLIPKGSHVLLSRIGLGRNSKVWTEPLKFKPERHLSNIIDGSSSYNNIALTEPDLRFISFSTGRRGCPGATLGTTMIIMLFARLLHGFTWSAAPNVSSINLAESKGDLFLAEPLVVVAKPRLAAELYNIKQ